MLILIRILDTEKERALSRIFHAGFPKVLGDDLVFLGGRCLEV